MRLLLSPALCLGLLAGSSLSLRADSGWNIARFDADLVLQSTGDLEVTETITADFEVPKHGIYREIPVRYAVNAHLYDLRFHLLGVDDGQDQRRPTKVSYHNNLVRLRIGDADRTVTGRQVYRIRYRVQRVVLWEGNRSWEREQAVLRWNATGTEWPVSIAATSAVLHLPRDLKEDELTYKAWTGRFGATGKDYTASRPDPRSIRFDTGFLGPGEGITIEAFLPADAVQQPTWFSRLMWVVGDNFPYALIPLTLLGCLGLWYIRGRDLPGRGTIVVEYDAPDNLRPAEVGTLIDERVDLRDLTATLIDLAVRGYLTIEEVKTDGWIRSGTDYRFRKKREPNDLKPFEKTLFKQLFRDGDDVLLSDLKERFYSAIPLARTHLYQALTGARYFDGNPTSVRTGFFIIGLLALVALLVICVIIQTILVGRVFPLPLVLSAVIGLLIIGITSAVMPRKTREGRIAWERIRGLEEYIRRAEISDIEEQDRRGVFEKLLPYAIALNLSDRWGKAFEGLYKEPPDWYRTQQSGPNFSTWYFVDSVNRSVNQMNTVLPSAPRSQGSSGSSGWSSGGFSGGGFSGGGFGGGGGGSW